MPKRGRVVVPGAVHHVVQRGARRQQTFFGPEDFVLYRDLIADRCEHYRVELLHYCLMPNHVHLLLRPSNSHGMARALGGAHSMFARRLNARRDWSGHFWQSRFWSHAVFGRRILAVARYIAQNPMRGRLSPDPWSWIPSSARSLAGWEDDPWVSSHELRGYLDGWPSFLQRVPPSVETDLIRQHMRTGEPLLPHIETRSAA